MTLSPGIPMSVVRIGPSRLRDPVLLQPEADQLFGNFAHRSPSFGNLQADSFVARTATTAAGTVIAPRAGLPGLGAGDAALRTANSILAVHGERETAEDKTIREFQVPMQAWIIGSSDRTTVLCAAAISVETSNGVLTARMPKPAHAVIKDIEAEHHGVNRPELLRPSAVTGRLDPFM